MPDTAVTVDRLQTLEVGLEFPAKITLDDDIQIVNRVDD